MDWQIPLLISAVVFAAFLIFKMRPTWSSDGREAAGLLKEAEKRVADAKDDTARAQALADAGDACAKLHRTNAAVNFYAKALKAMPSKAIVDRASTSLSRRPLAIEKLMWRHLANGPWTGPAREPALAALSALIHVYDRSPSRSPRARAIEHALSALGQQAKT